MPWPNRDGRQRYRSSRRAPARCLGFSRRFDLGRIAEAEVADRAVECRRTDRHAHLGGADVVGVGDDVLERLAAAGPGHEAVLGVVDHVAADLEHIARRKAARRLDSATLEGGRGGDQLEGRAGLVGVGDRAVAPRVGADARIVRGVEVGDVRHREDLARPRPSRRPSALRVPLLHVGAQPALGFELDVRVDRQAQGAPGTGFSMVVRRTGSPGRTDRLRTASCPVSRAGNRRTGIRGRRVRSHRCRRNRARSRRAAPRARSAPRSLPAAIRYPRS